MSNGTLDSALQIYLGGDINSPEIQVRGGGKRLQAAYPSEYSVLQEQCEGFLEEFKQNDSAWKHLDLAKIGPVIEAELKPSYPWLSPVTLAKLANYYCYEWK